MPLSIESIYNPVEQFFLHTFQSEPDSPVFFRFRRFAFPISPLDYVDPANPANTAYALEPFSHFANSLPIEDSDGMHVSFGADLIDSRYESFLQSSRALVDPSDPNADEIFAAFNAIRNDAQYKWEINSFAGALPVAYRPSYATPTNWYDNNGSNVWSAYSLEVHETVVHPTWDDPNFRLWRFLLNSELLYNILPSLGSTEAQATNLITDLVFHKPEFSVLFQTSTPEPNDNTHSTNNAGVLGQPDVNLPNHPPDDDDEWPDVEEPPVEEEVVEEEPRFKHRFKKLHLQERVAVLDYVRENAPTQPTETTTVKISFEYCTINIRRPWVIDTFLRNKLWFMPGTPRGSESAPGAAMNLSALPVAMIAIRNLRIEADWSQVDIDASKRATNFGPFEIKTEIINNAMTHEGIQVIGYLLQRMPELPPNDPPQQDGPIN